MPGSEPDAPEPRLTRGWWAGLLGGLGLLTVWCLFNVFVDPTGEFGQSGRHAFNRAPLAPVAGENRPAAFTRAIRESRAEVFLIGTSRQLRGFDTCDRPDVLRVAGPRWGLREIAAVERTVLTGRRSPVELLIEVGLPTIERPAVDPTQAAVATVLSPRTTLSSLRTVGRSLTGGDRALPPVATCRPAASGPTDWAAAERRVQYALGMLDTTPDSLARGRTNLRAMVDQADQVCRRTGVRHRLVFFTLPSTPAGSPALAHDRLIQSNTVRVAAVLAAGRPADGCDVRYVNFASTPPGTAAEQALWRDRDQWSDYNHFSPRLGATALTALLGPVL